MKKKNIYFVQTGCVFNDEHFLPYSVGVLAAYAFKNEKISSYYELAGLIYKSDEFNKTLDEIENPSVVAFSCYMWNYEFNLRLAGAVKERYPECITIFGGHQISDTKKWLEEYPSADFAVMGEGEETVTDILLMLCGEKDIASVGNISYRNGDNVVTNPKKRSTLDINEIPSPYLTGIFDKILKNSKDKFAAVIETSRGCPYHCAYCDWGNPEMPMRYFDVDRVKQEIEYIGKNSVVFVVLADSNFGIGENDEEIADKFIETKKKYGYPKAMEMAFAKHNPSRVFSINKKLYENDMSRGATLSMQSLNPLTLKNIGRENITKEKFSELLRLYSEHNIPSYTELILGLPGETYESFCYGIDYLLDNGQHNSIHVFYCEILPNALMGSEQYIEKHGIKTLERDFTLRNGMNSVGIGGKSKIIVSTDTMSAEDYLKSILYAFTVQVFHNFGLLRVVALYFHYEKDMSYKEFYNALIAWMEEHSDTFVGEIFSRFRNKYKMSLNGSAYETYENELFGETQFNLQDGAFLEIMRSSEEFYIEIAEFVQALSEGSFVNSEMLRFQKMIIRKPENVAVNEEFSYDWLDFYRKLIEGKKTPLQKKNTRISVFESSEYNDLSSYVEAVVIKGRRTGKSIILNDMNAFSVEYTE